jgi:hypothetical protein
VIHARLLALGLAAAVTAPAAALLVRQSASPASQAQRRTCNIEFPNTPETRQVSYTLPTGNRNIFWGGGVHAICRRERMDIRADSAEYYGDEKRLFLVGHVVYDEPRIHLTSDYLTYFGIDERVVASSNVNVRLPNGSTMVGPQAEYQRKYALRPQSLLNAIGRPTITLKEREAPGAKPEPPTTVLATTVVVVADSLIHGIGQVEITRPDLVAKGDSAFIDSGTEYMSLARQPSIEGRKSKPYRLAGQLIDLYSRRRHLQRVVSRGSAQANSEDMTLTSDTIQLRVDADLLQEAVAWGKGRARAKSPTQDIVADSIRVDMPSQRVREVHALRSARAEAMPDTLRLHTRERDWLSGDTVVALFDTTAVPQGDTTRRAQIRRLRAAGDARSYYHLASADTSAREPAINYVRGRVITVDFDSARVATVAVQGRSSGLYLEPSRADTAAQARAATPGNRPPAGGQPAPSTRVLPMRPRGRP